MSSCPITAVIWQGASPSSDGRTASMSYMLQPVVRSVIAGLRAASQHRINVVFGGGFGPELKAATAPLGRGDIFVWVGVYKVGIFWNDPDAKDAKKNSKRGWPILAQMKRQQVYTVFYSTDAVASEPKPEHFCWLNNDLDVHEIWEYSHSTTRFCNHSRHGIRHPTRYVPPGYVPSVSWRGRLGVDYYADASSAKGELAFLAGLASPARQACWRNLSSAMAAHDPRSAVVSVTAREAPPSRTLTTALGLLHVDTVWTDASMSKLLETHAFFLNMHRECYEPPAQTDCETLRFAQLVSYGAIVISDRCHADDETEWNGLVHFADRRDMPRLFHSLWQQAHARPPAAKFGLPLVAEFARRLSPKHIFERAGTLMTSDDL